MVILMLILSVLAYVAIMLLSGSLGKNVFQNNRDRFVFQMSRDILCFLMMALLFHTFRPHGFTLLLSGAMGFAVLLSSVFSITSYRYGPVGISIMIFSSFTMLLSSLAGPIFWGEPISLLQIAGMALSILSMFLITEKSLVKKASFKWILCLLLAGIGGGMQGPVQKILATSPYAEESTEFITYTFAFSVTASFLAMLIVCGDFGKKKKHAVIDSCSASVAESAGAEKLSYRINGKIFFAFFGAAILSLFLNINNLDLVKKLPTVIFFPSYTVGGLLLTNIATGVLFKEKMTLRQKIGFAVGLLALLLISGTIDGLL